MRVPRSGRRVFRTCSTAILLVLSLGVAADSFALAAEPTQAAGPPVRDGLEFWFDVAQIEAGDAAASVESSEGVPLAVWPDASGHGRDARQENETARPTQVTVGERHVVRFDGTDDHLRIVGNDLDFDAATVFLVVAPRSNFGGFQGFFATNETGHRDYETGFTIDMGATASPSFRSLNVEGRGFGGARNLMFATYPFGSLHVVDVVARPQAKEVRLTVDGISEPNVGRRDFAPSTLSFDEQTIGARYYTNGPGEQQVRGFFEGDIAEILVYRRELSADELQRVRAYLTAKHATLEDELARVAAVADGKPLESIADPPPLQMFVPGFTVRELPVELPNVNNVRYRPDGTLIALAYDGDVYVLSDSDGDGLEDEAELFWENDGRVRSPIGMALTTPDYKHGDGLFVATKSECLLITDTDDDRKADGEIVVASGWQESFHNVDALGVAVDPKDGSVYFGLGTANFADPYLRDKDGNSAYRLDGERAAILKVSPDFKSREVYCTGIRFPVSLGFNAAGDLFCTDQEGATWVPNGNPLDELIHLRPDRHYGFPPRHPRLLPDVVDEPSTYNYSPQHQSTCGLFFNDSVNGGPAFGSEFWSGDALVCGYSRGKLYRTKLAKTPAGYVADNRLIASLDMLTVDSCVTPEGSLVVAVHSGGPDWGSGPGGAGKLYKVAYTDKAAPQPVATWAAGPGEVRIAFDRPLDTTLLRRLAEGTEITYGDAVRAGDEFELLRPGYEVVGRQIATPRFDLPVHSAQITPDRRTLILSTDVHPKATWYAVRLPGLGRPSEVDSTTDGRLPQLPRIDLDYSLGGVEASWQSENGDWTDWLPHLDLGASRTFTGGSAIHDALWKALDAGKGRLTLRTQLDLTHMLQARVQPGSKLDYELTPEHVTATVTASEPFTLKTPTGEVTAEHRDDGYVAAFETETTTDTPAIPLEVVLESESGKPDLTVSWHTAESEIPRPLATVRMTLPWAKRSSEPVDPLAERVIPELAGGSWAKGRAVFFGEKASCSKCHAVHGNGGTIGPDLSNLVHRDYASVFRDVNNPSYAVNPDYIAHAIVLKDGRVLTGTLHGDGDRLLVSDTQAKTTEVSRDDVEEMAPSTKSIMPDGLQKQISPEAMKDLLTFLLTKPPQMPLDGPGEPPPPRTRVEVQSVLAGAPEPPLPARPIRVVLVAGEKDHGPGEHDYPAWQEAWSELLAAGDDVGVGTAWDWPSADDFATADVLVFYQKGLWTPERAKDIDAFLNRGGGLVYIHYAVDGGTDAPGFAQRIGLAWQGGRSKFRHGPLELGFSTGESHPIGRNLSTLKLVDESYWNLVGDPAEVRLLASGVEDGEPQPLFWTLEPSKGRVFVSIPGHYSWTFDDPLFRIVLLRGIAWAAKEPVDRFNELVTPGARLAE
ncbi:MAG: ThuA domain-containing protein [Planctomycetaceae bacterium]